jgi:CBS domain-containing protein
MTERRVRDVMTRKVVAVREGTPFKELVALLTERKFAALPVVDTAHRVVGIVSEEDLLFKEEFHDDPDRMVKRRWWRGLPKYKAAATDAHEVMRSPATVISADATIVEAARLMDARGVKRLPVVDTNDALVGILAPRDILNVFLRPDAEIRREIIEDVFVGYLHANPALITVDVQDGVVALRGEVQADSHVGLAMRMAAAVDGVVAVRGHLFAAVHDRRLPRTADITDY